MADYDDKPITSPEEDILGFNPFAEAIADSISKMEEPEGTVIAINGPWGSGKSSAINLVRHHLSQKEDVSLKIVDFKCWWFRGEEALTVAFFRELCSVFGPSLTRKARKALPKLGQILSIAGTALSAVGTFNVPLAGVGKAASGIGKLFGRQEETVEKLHKEIFDALQKGSNRYLIVIDDIDRLSPDEAILIFGLVKSVGGLPNVMYLLAYDRQLAEKIVAKRYPSEGPHYLEKIVQAPFDLPVPSQTALNREFSRRLAKVVSVEGLQDKTHFRNLYNDLIAPEIKTPRDVIRILNPLQVTWAAVKEEVNPADFLCLETLRIQRPELYRRLKANKDRLTRGAATTPGNTSPSPEPSEQYDAILLAHEPKLEHGRLRDGLMRLFPALTHAWRKVNIQDIQGDSWEDWDRRRRVCSPKHFDTYFRFSLSENAVSEEEISTLMASMGDSERIQRLFLDAAKVKLANGSTKAQELLEALRIRGDEVPDSHIDSLLNSIYSIADCLARAESREDMDHLKFGKTLHRVFELTRRLTVDRLTPERRSSVIREACNDATLAWLTKLAAVTCDEYQPEGSHPPESPERCLITQSQVGELKDLSIKRICEAAGDGSLIDCPFLREVLLWWKKAEGGDEAVRSWVSTVIHRDEVAVVRIAEAFMGVNSRSSGPWDSIPEQNLTALTCRLSHVTDLGKFRARAEQVLEEGSLEARDRETLEKFLDACRRQKRTV